MRLFLAMPLLAASALAADPGLIMYIGTYTGPNSKGIYAFRFDPDSGRASPLGVAAETPNPSFLAADPSHRFLYAVNEIGEYEGRPTGSVSAFTIDRATGRLELLNRVSSQGAGPCHLAVDKTGKLLVVANYGSGSHAGFPIGPDGKLGEATSEFQHSGSSVNPQRQKGPHAHCAAFSPHNRYVAIADLGLDKILIDRIGADGRLTPNSPPFAGVRPGSGPRHFVFHPNGRFAYVINEMASSITAFRWDSKRGALTEIETVSTLPTGFKGENTTAEIEIHPNGRFLYGSNRGTDDIAVFAIDPAKGTLAAVAHVSTEGRTPRAFKIDPGGKHLVAANQDSGNIVVFRIDGRTGRLMNTGQKIDAPSPVSVLFVPAR
jgi:6-phosphogluconolactonase